MPHSNNPTTKDLRDRRNGRAKTREKTSAQVVVAKFGLTQPELSTSYPDDNDWFTLVREMRKDPTLALIRDLVLGPILASEWSVTHTDQAPKGAVELVQRNMMSIRSYLVTHTLLGLMDFGHQAFEKVWSIDSYGDTVIDKVKPLLQDITRILVNTENGEFAGVIQRPIHGKKFEIVRIGHDLAYGASYLKAHETLLCNINVEGTYWYGRPIMENAIMPYNGWNAVNDTADRYDKKIAGSHWVIHYPLGTSNLDGIETDNFQLAQLLIQNLESSGAIAVPRYIDETIQELNAGAAPNGWQVELLSDQSSQQSNFIDRLKYYDNLKTRALGFPERSVLEGQFGTKAEAETHSDLAVVIAEYRHDRITEQISYQLVNDLLRYNYGKDAVGTVSLKAAPIADDLRIFLRSVFLTLMQHDPETALRKVDGDEMRERLGIRPNLNEGDESEFQFPERTETNDQQIGKNIVTGKPGATKLNPMPGERTNN